MIQLFHVSKYYDRRPALSDVTLEIEKGEFVLLMGPSGAGKSTLLKLLIGAERPEEGQVLIQGRSLSKLRASEIPVLRRKVGVVLQDFRLLPKKTVFENVSLPLLVQGASTTEIRRKVAEALLRRAGPQERSLPRAFHRGAATCVSHALSSTGRSCSGG